MDLQSLFSRMQQELGRHDVSITSTEVSFRHGPVASFATLPGALFFEAVYRRLFLIRERDFELLTVHHEPRQRTFYFVLRETNHRFVLPTVVFAPIVFAVHYDADNHVREVVNHFDFTSWVLEHMGLDAAFHRLSTAATRLVGPLARRHAEGLARTLMLGGDDGARIRDAGAQSGYNDLDP